MSEQDEFNGGLYHVTRRQLAQPEKWDVQGIIDDIRHKLLCKNDEQTLTTEAVALIGHLLDEVARLKFELSKKGGKQ